MPHSWETKWVTGEKIGKGGQGFTFKVSHREDPSILGALKHLRNNRDPQSRGRMRREVTALQTLANDGGSVPRVLDHNTDAFSDASVELYVVMDLIDGPTLREYVEKNGQLGIDVAVKAVLSLCKTVEIAHAAPILHRDLKPDNIIVRKGNVDDLVTVDYGLSFNVNDEGLTETDENFRSEFIALPETNTKSSDHRDPRSDVTALCGILYYCLTGHNVGHLHDSQGNLPHLRPGFAVREVVTNDVRVSQVEAILTRGLSPPIANRFQTVEELIEKMTPIVASSREVDVSDPFQMAELFSEKLRLHDRKTQLAEFKKEGEKLLNFIRKEHSKYHDKLHSFRVDVRVGGARQKVDANGMDVLSLNRLVFAVSVSLHPQQYRREFIVMSRASQCGLFVRDYYSGKDDAPEAGVVLSEIAWYEGSSEPIHQLVSLSIRQWVTEKITLLGKRLAP